MPIHIQFHPEDILESKYLIQESRFLYFQSLKSQENYIKIRGRELKLKAQLKAKLKLFSSSLKFLQSSLPEINEKEMEEAESRKGFDNPEYSFIEQDLRDIQSNLKRITKV